MANTLPLSTAQTPAVPVETLAARAGQVIEARVFGAGQGGTTKLAIGDVLVEAALSVRIQAGAVIRLLIQGTGQNTRLTVLPNPQQGQTQQGHTPQQQTPRQQTPQTTLTAPVNAPPGSAAQVQGAALSPQPAVAASVAASVPPSQSVPVSHDQTQTASGAPPRGGVRAEAPNVTPLRPAAVVTPGQTAPVQGPASPPSPGQIASGQSHTVQVATGHAASSSATPVQAPASQNGVPGAGQGQPPPAPRGVQPVAPAQSIAPSQSVAPAQIEPGTVLQFQIQGAGANARPVLVPVTPPRSVNTTTQGQSPAQPVHPVQPALPALVPNPLAQALAQTAQTAVLRQDSIATLLTNLAGLGAQLFELPRPVAQAGARLLAGQLDLSARPLDGAGLKDALLRSGPLLENTLLKSGAQPPAQGDLKSALLNLRNALRAWLGGKSQPPARNEQRPPPPTSGAQPRAARPARQPPALVLPNVEAGAKLLGQAEASLARMRLIQISSLPEAGARPAQGPAGPASELNIELPLLHGGELGVGQFQISRDGGKDGARDRNGEWKLRFSINFSQTGEVGATVSLRGGKTGVMLWAEREETAAALLEAQGELADSLSARGLEPGPIRCRHGHPPQAKRPVGAFMDNCS